MMNNDKYNKVKILSDLSALCWFIEQHALIDAKKENDQECMALLENIKKDLDKHITTVEKSTCK